MLGHVNYNSIQRLINHQLLPSIILEKKHKYEIYVELKFTKSFFFQTVKRNSESLNLFHSCIGDLKFVQVRCGKKYYIIFINDNNHYNQ